MASIEKVTEALADAWFIVRDPSFAKTFDFAGVGERRLLPLVGMFLAGSFPYKVSREHTSALPGFGLGKGRIDYMVAKVAVELAVRRTKDAQSKLFPTQNKTEVRKLLKHRGPAILALFDFAPTPADTGELERQYRNWRDLCGIGSGKHNLSAFNVRYFYTEGGEPRDPLCFNIRV